MAMIETWVNQDLTAPVQVVYLPGNVFSQDNNGNLIGVNVFQGGEPATLSGSVSASVIRADGATVAVTGSLSGNQCSVVLPQACYAVPGVLSIVIKLTSGETVTTVGAVVANVYRSSTDTAVDPGQIIPDIAALIAEIEAAVALIPADYSGLTAEIITNADKIFTTGEQIPIAATSAGWKLIQSTGLCTTDSGYKIVKYPVKEGTTVKVETDGMFQFQTVASVPSNGQSNRIGLTYTGGTYTLDVPSGATYLIVSILNSGVSVVNHVYDNIEGIKAATDEFFSKYSNVDILKPAFISDSSRRYNSGITYALDNQTGVVTADGTAVYDAWIHLYPVGTFDASSGGLYFLSGCPSGGSANTYYVYLETESSATLCKDTGNGVFIELASGQNVRVSFLVKAGVTVSALSFKPQFFKITNGGQTTESIIEMWQNGAQFQYWNNETQKTDKYFTLGSNGEINENASSGYRINTMLCQPGKIYYKQLSGAFTIIVDLVSKTAVTLQNGYGKSQYIHDGSITVSHPVMIFATSNDVRQPLVTNSPVFPSYYVYGKYCGERVVTIGEGCDFTTLKDGIAYAVQFEDAVVNVLAGTYDIISEFGDAYFEALDSSSSEMSGIQIGNGITINFSPQAKVVCNYTGENQYARIKFSPFNMMPGSKGFTLNGLDLECSNVRYAVHDECNANAAYYENKYIDCKMSKDNSQATGWLNPLVIGGGLGQNGRIDIIRCYFYSETIPPYTTGKSVNYHNASPAGSKSALFVADCYFDGAYTCGLSYYGTSTEITEMQVNGCSLPAEPYINQEGAASVVNVAIRKFNNEIR